MRTWFALLTASLAAAFLAACAPGGPGPKDVVTALYAPYLSKAAETGAFDWSKQPVYSKGLRAVMDHGFAYSDLLNEPVIDYDPIVNAQDFQIANVTTSEKIEGDKATVTAKFTNYNEPVEVTYSMVKEGGVWKIDDIGSGDGGLRKIVDDALKPIADPEAMKSSVQQIYEMYSPPHNGAGAPMVDWAPLSKGFAAQIKAAGAKYEMLIPFDPITDGVDVNETAINLEAASGAVIARLGEGASQHIVVYDLVEQDGEWKVADIRGPNAAKPWDVSMALSDAGFK